MRHWAGLRKENVHMLLQGHLAYEGFQWQHISSGSWSGYLLVEKRYKLNRQGQYTPPENQYENLEIQYLVDPNWGIKNDFKIICLLSSNVFLIPVKAK